MTKTKKETTLSVLKDIRTLLQKIVDNKPVSTTQEYFKIIDGPGKRTSDLLNECKNKFKVWSFYSDEQLDKDFPTPEKETTRYFKKTVEPDADLMNKSAEELKDIPCITIRERLIMELQYFKETGNNLDVENITLCVGSRYAAGDVPSVDRSGGGGVRVRRCGPRHRDAGVGARRAVSL